MRLYCTEEFIQQVKTLRKYEGLQALLAAHYCGATFEQAREGTLLMASPPDIPTVLFVKKRLGGDGGFRVYVFAKVLPEIVCLGYVHPKTGVYGVPNLSNPARTAVQKQVLAALSRKSPLYEVSSPDGKTLAYKQV